MPIIARTGLLYMLLGSNVGCWKADQVLKSLKWIEKPQTTAAMKMTALFAKFCKLFWNKIWQLTLTPLPSLRTVRTFGIAQIRKQMFFWHVRTAGSQTKRFFLQRKTKKHLTWLCVPCNLLAPREEEEIPCRARESTQMSTHYQITALIDLTWHDMASSQGWIWTGWISSQILLFSF